MNSIAEIVLFIAEIGIAFGLFRLWANAMRELQEEKVRAEKVMGEQAEMLTQTVEKLARTLEERATAAEARVTSAVALANGTKPSQKYSDVAPPSNAGNRENAESKDIGPGNTTPRLNRKPTPPAIAAIQATEPVVLSERVPDTSSASRPPVGPPMAATETPFSIAQVPAADAEISHVAPEQPRFTATPIVPVATALPAGPKNTSVSAPASARRATRTESAQPAPVKADPGPGPGQETKPKRTRTKAVQASVPILADNLSHVSQTNSESPEVAPANGQGASMNSERRNEGLKPKTVPTPQPARELLDGENKYSRVYECFGQGISDPIEIERLTGIPRGEVELLVRLRGRAVS